MKWNAIKVKVSLMCCHLFECIVYTHCIAFHFMIIITRHYNGVSYLSSPIAHNVQLHGNCDAHSFHVQHQQNMSLSHTEIGWTLYGCCVWRCERHNSMRFSCIYDVHTEIRNYKKSSKNRTRREEKKCYFCAKKIGMTAATTVHENLFWLTFWMTNNVFLLCCWVFHFQFSIYFCI